MTLFLSISCNCSCLSGSKGGNYLPNPFSLSMEVVTRKNISNMKDMSAVEVVLSPGMVCRFLRLKNILGVWDYFLRKRVARSRL